MNQVVETLKANGEAALADGRFIDAQNFYQEILAKSPFASVGLLGLIAVAAASGQLESLVQNLLVTAIDLAEAGQSDDAMQCIEAVANLACDVSPSDFESIIVILVAGAISFAKSGRFDELKKCVDPLFKRIVDLSLEAAISILNELNDSLSDSNAFEIRISCMRALSELQPDSDIARFNYASSVHSYACAFTFSDPQRAIPLAEEVYGLYPDNDEVARHLLLLRSLCGPAERRDQLLSEMIARFDRRAPSAPPPQGLRELQGESMTADDIADALLADGAVLIRNMITASDQDYLIENIESNPWKKDDQAMRCILRPSILDGMAKIFGRPAVGMIQASGVRVSQASDDQTYLFYHQDLVPLYTMGINLWAALDPIDGTRPGLEVIVRRQHKAFPVQAGNIRDSTDYEIPAELVRAAFDPNDFVRPQMAVGDGMMFLFSTVHSSHVAPGMTNSRRNMEFRFI